MWLVFAIGAMLAWGSYGPFIHTGQVNLGSPIRAFLCVGFAYFLTAVLVPGAMLLAQEEAGAFTGKGVAWGLMAGAVGAAGAICVIFAMKTGGTPIYVMPIVFGGAPIMNSIVSMIQHPPKSTPNLLFFLGIVLAGIGAGLILRFKPA
jgi:hypothetical protein